MPPLLPVLMAVLVLTRGQRPAHNGSRYGFFRSMIAIDKIAPGTRRIFGGNTAELSSFPTACALLDRQWKTHCSAAVVTKRWALTAAHCVVPRVTYVKYNTRLLSSSEGEVSRVLYLYRHPDYEVVEMDMGHGSDVVTLRNDVGLVQTRTDMMLITALRFDPVKALHMYNPIELKNREVQVFGFGRTESKAEGEELFSVQLRLVYCNRGNWYYCVCGISTERSGRGVCNGDSGGPLVYNGVQVGVTSMGPLECASRYAQLPIEATSVFTSLYNYADIVNNTVYGTDVALKMKKISGAKRNQYTYILLPLATLVLWLR